MIFPLQAENFQPTGLCAKVLFSSARLESDYLIPDRHARQNHFGHRGGPGIFGSPETVAPTHAQLQAGLPRNVTPGAHDLIIGATALTHGFALLSANVADFKRMPGIVLVPFE